ncbi:MAG: hypothetical protein JO106_05570, partial [Mycobacterium sp.]|nr:hypothetical protein [Mycobacterium sp.]
RDDRTTRAIRDDLLANAVNPTIGRNLGRFFADVGVVVETVRAQALLIRDPATARRLFLLDDAAKRVGTDAAGQWLAAVSDATPESGFCAALTQFAVVGTRSKTDP